MIRGRNQILLYKKSLKMKMKKKIEKLVINSNKMSYQKNKNILNQK